MTELTAADIPRLTLQDAEQAREYMPRPIWYENVCDYEDFYEGRTRKGRIYHCPECGNYFSNGEGEADHYCDDPGKLHHGDTMTCFCGYTATLLCVGRMRSFETVNDNEYFVFAKAKDGWLWLICAVGRRTYSREELDPVPELDVEKVYAFQPGKRAAWRRVWEYDLPTKRYIPRMREMKSTDGPAFSGFAYGSARMYFFIGGDAVRESEMRYCAWEEFYGGQSECEPKRGVEKYMNLYSKLPMVEMLVKSGLSAPVAKRLHGEKGSWNWKAKKPWEFLRLTKSDYRIFREIGMSAKDLDYKNKIFPDMSLQEYREYHVVWGAYLAEAVGLYGQERCWKKLCRWWKPENKWWEWQDLLRMEQEVGNDISHEDVLMPEDVHQRHEELVRLTEKIKLDAIAAEYEKRKKKLKRRFEYSDGDMMILVPEDGTDISDEGQALQHCVKGYAERHLKGVTCILFLRFCSSPGTRYVTIELNEETLTIRQIHGYHNDDYYSKKPEEIHQKFLQEWLDWVRAGSRRGRRKKDAA